MNAKQILIAVGIVAISAATVAMAQDATAPASAAPAATAPATAGGGHKGRHEEKFADRKAHALTRLEKAAAKIQQKQSCVQASTDKESLQACFPKRGQGKGGKGGWHKHGGKGGASSSDTGAAEAPAADAPASK